MKKLIFVLPKNSGLLLHFIFPQLECRQHKDKYSVPVQYAFKSTCLRLRWSCLDLLLYGKDQKEVVELILIHEWRILYQDIIISFVRVDKHSELSCRGSWLGTHKQDWMEKHLRQGGLDHEYQEFAWNIQKFQVPSGQSYLLLISVSKNLGITSAAMIKMGLPW